jgi:hypothetical protein
MLNTNSLSNRPMRNIPRRSPREMPRTTHPLWCDVCDTPWVATMRRQVATAALVDGRGFARAWRFSSV